MAVIDSGEVVSKSTNTIDPILSFLEYQTLISKLTLFIMQYHVINVELTYRSHGMMSFIFLDDESRHFVYLISDRINHTWLQTTIMDMNAEQECQWSGQKLYGSAECVWLSLKFTHYQIFYQRLILFNVP